MPQFPQRCCPELEKTWLHVLLLEELQLAVAKVRLLTSAERRTALILSLHCQDERGTILL